MDSPDTKTTPLISPGAAPAHALGVELKTRITTQALAFQDLAETLLNKTLRPYTARWQGRMTEDNRANRPESLPKLGFPREFFDAPAKRPQIGDALTKLKAIQASYSGAQKTADDSKANHK